MQQIYRKDLKERNKILHLFMKENEWIVKKEQEFEFYKQVGLNIRKFRKLAGFTQDDLAFMMSISRVSVNNIELGKQRLPSHLISAICGLFKVYIHEIIPNYNYGIKSGNDLFEHKKNIAFEKLNEKFA
jgi:transcriptional regulator with XRE-family HTH domain